MTYQDEFARRLGTARGTATGEDAAESRHPEPVSGPRSAEPADGGKTDGILRRAQDDDTPHTVSGEPVEPRLSDEKRPSTGSGLTDQDDTPHTHTPRHDGWLPDIRVKFLEALSRTGNVGAAAYFVQRSRQSAYDLRRRDPDFARGWQAALVLARDVAEDVLQERAIDGIEEPVYYHGEVVGTRRRYDSRLLLAHLGRLDKAAEQIPARRAAARFEELMAAIRTGADTAPLIATPTDDELAAAAAQAEALRPPAEEEGDEFYAIHWPEEEDRPPDYYRMTPEEAAEMERDVPGLIAIPTGTRSNALATALHIEELARFEVAEKRRADRIWDGPGAWDGGAEGERRS